MMPTIHGFIVWWCYRAMFAWNLSYMWMVSNISWSCSSFGLYKYDWARL